VEWGQVGFEQGVLKGVFPLHGVTGAKRRREGAGPLAGALGFSSSATSNSRLLRQIVHNKRAGLGPRLESELRIPKQRFEP